MPVRIRGSLIYDFGNVISESQHTTLIWVNPTTGSDVPTSTRPARITGGNFMGEPFATIAAAIKSLPSLINHEVRIKLSSLPDGPLDEINLNGKVIGGIDEFPASIIFEPTDPVPYIDYTPTTGLATGTVASGLRNQIVVTGAGWVPGELEGRAIEFAGQTWGIIGNTADTLDLIDLDFSWLTPDTESFQLKDWAVQLSYVAAHECYGLIEIHQMKANDGFFINNCSNFVAEECSLSGISIQDCRSVSLNKVISTGSGFRSGLEVLGVDYFYGEVGVNNANGFTLTNCRYIQFNKIAAVGDGIRIEKCSDVFIRGIVNRCYGAVGPTIEGSVVRFSGQYGNFIDTARFAGIRVDDNSHVIIGGNLEGSSVTDGWGLSIPGVGSSVRLEMYPNPTLTGANGDVRLDEINLSWGDLIDPGGAEVGVSNLTTGSRTYAPVRI